MKRLFLVDLENVPNSIYDIKYCDFKNTDSIVVFYNSTQKTKIESESKNIDKAFHGNARYVLVSNYGTKNAMDFNICIYAGIIVGGYSGRKLEIHIVSKDNGYKAIDTALSMNKCISVVYESNFYEYFVDCITTRKIYNPFVIKEGYSRIWCESMECYVSTEGTLLSVVQGNYSNKEKLVVRRALICEFGCKGREILCFVMENAYNINLKDMLVERYCGRGSLVYEFLCETTLYLATARRYCCRDVIREF